MKDEKLKKLFETYPKTKVSFMDINSDKRWPEWKEYDTCSKEELKQANLRQLFPNEVILDLEDKQFLENVKADLNKSNFIFEIWETGSRGIHFHLYFDELNNLDMNEKRAFRGILVNRNNCDPAKISEYGLIAMENKPHFKTGRTKNPIEYNEGTNIIGKDLLELVKQEGQKVKELNESISAELDEKFVNYSTKDEFFVYIKTNIIPDERMRDTIIFKNVAVGLVKEGLNDNEIEKLMKPIIKNNFPGKTYNEFKGWINKVRRGELSFYNIYEINEWSKKFKYPVFYKESQDSNEIVKTYSLKQLWNEYWNEKIIGQEVWRDLLFYSMIGCVLDERDENLDLRIHVIFSSFTSSGKDTGINLMMKILDDERLDLKTCKPTETTDKYLIGGVDNNAVDFNKKHNLEPGEPGTIKNTQVTGREEIIFGAFYHFNLLAFTECEVVFSPTVFNKRIQLNMRRVMDIERKPDKGVGNSRITYFCNPTIILTAYPQRDVIKTLLENGLFQRAFYYDNEFDEKMAAQIHDFLIRNKNDPTEEENSSKYREEIIKRLIKIKEYYGKNKPKFIRDLYKEYNLKYVQYLKEKIDSIKVSYSILDVRERLVLDAIITRGIDNMMRVMILDTLASKTKSLTRENIDVSFNLFGKCLLSLRNLIWDTKRSKYLAMNLNVDKNIKGIVSLINIHGRDGEIELSDLVKLVEEVLNIKSSATIYKWINITEKEGFIKRKQFESGEKNKKIASITEKGKELL